MRCGRGSEAERGTAAAVALLLLVGVLIVSSALAAYLAGVAGLSVSVADDSQARAKLRSEVERAARALAEDETPESDSRFDRVWSIVGHGGGTGTDTDTDTDTAIALEDVSSRLNPNWMRTMLLEQTELDQLLAPGVEPDEVRDYRSEAGFFMELSEGYGELFTEEALSRYLTPHAYLNVNVSYETVLRDVVELRTDDSAAADAFLGEVRSVIEQQQLLDREGLEDLLGTNYDTVFPLVNTEPLLNVHYAEEFLIEQILAYPYGGEPIEGNAAVAQTLLRERAAGELSPDELRALVPAEGAQQRVFEYLGTTTWFWRVRVSGDELTLEAVLARLPARTARTSGVVGAGGPRYRVVAERWR